MRANWHTPVVNRHFVRAQRPAGWASSFSLVGQCSGSSVTRSCRCPFFEQPLRRARDHLAVQLGEQPDVGARPQLEGQHQHVARQLAPVHAHLQFLQVRVAAGDQRLRLPRLPVAADRHHRGRHRRRRLLVLQRVVFRRFVAGLFHLPAVLRPVGDDPVGAVEEGVGVRLKSRPVGQVEEPPFGGRQPAFVRRRASDRPRFATRPHPLFRPEFVAFGDRPGRAAIGRGQEVDAGAGRFFVFHGDPRSRLAWVSRHPDRILAAGEARQVRHHLRPGPFAEPQHDRMGLALVAGRRRPAGPGDGPELRRRRPGPGQAEVARQGEAGERHRRHRVTGGVAAVFGQRRAEGGA